MWAVQVCSSISGSVKQRPLQEWIKNQQQLQQNRASDKDSTSSTPSRPASQLDCQRNKESRERSVSCVDLGNRSLVVHYPGRADT